MRTKTFEVCETSKVFLQRDDLGRILVVMYVWRGNAIRIISARKATGREQSVYLQNS